MQLVDYPPLLETHFQLPGIRRKYRGKVRDVYQLSNGYIVLVATDRISAFDTPLSHPVPYKGEILNGIAAYFLNKARDVVLTWWEGSPDPTTSVGRYYSPLPIEFIVRGYLCGHALRQYIEGHRVLSGQPLPEGLMPYQQLPRPILTPTIKSFQGHDEDITPEEIIRQGIVDETTWQRLHDTAIRLFEQGTQYAADRGLILADTKYEFAVDNGRVILIDEVHTPDSSRYFYADDYRQAMQEGRPPQQLSKEFIRQWLLRQGIVDPRRRYDVIPIPLSAVHELLKRYVTVYEHLLGKPFHFSDRTNLHHRIECNIRKYLQTVDG